MAEPISTPWQPHRSRQQEGMKSEAKQAKKYGARLHPRSGAGSIKDDASDEDTVYEFKDVSKTHTLKGDYLDDIFRRAAKQGKQARYVVRFDEADVEVDMIIRRTS